jgi:hypothetical protein
VVGAGVVTRKYDIDLRIPPTMAIADATRMRDVFSGAEQRSASSISPKSLYSNGSL